MASTRERSRPTRQPDPSGSLAAAWAALRVPVFRYLWIATVVSNVGTWMYNAASGWLMTSLDADPLIVSLVQVANSVPLFLFALPAGALADLVDRRRLILTLEILTTLCSALFAALIALHLATPKLLLLFIFLIGILGALESPTWQAIVPQLVPREALSSAIATNSLGVNISRVAGPALAGALILGLGIAAPFWLDAVSNLGVIGVILWWRAPAVPKSTLPAERFTRAIRAGLRYAHNNRQLRATLLRAAGFFLFASAYWALLPLLARGQLHGGPALYGALLGCIGAGAVGGALLLPKLRARYGLDGLATLGQIGTALALLLFAIARQEAVGLLACAVAGVAWITALASLNVSAQTALPEWVRGRGLAAYVTVFFGSMSAGSALWGYLANRGGLPLAHAVAGAGALLGILYTRRWRLHSDWETDLRPSMHWPQPLVSGEIEQDAGPVLVTVEYHVMPEHRAALLSGLRHVARERKRDGAYRWGVFEDVAHPGRILETFLVDSWLEHLRQHQRVTNSDRLVQERIGKLLSEAPKVTHFLNADAGSAAQAQPAQ